MFKVLSTYHYLHLTYRFKPRSAEWQSQQDPMDYLCYASLDYSVFRFIDFHNYKTKLTNLDRPNQSFRYFFENFAVIAFQCDQVGQFIGLWATFQSPRPQLICPNLLHFQAIFVKVSKSFIFLGKSFWVTFTDIRRFFTGHTAAFG